MEANFRSWFRRCEHLGPLLAERIVTDLDALGIRCDVDVVEAELAKVGYQQDDAGGWWRSPAETDKRIAELEQLAGDAVTAALNIKEHARDGAPLRHLQAVDDVRLRLQRFRGARAED